MCGAGDFDWDLLGAEEALTSLMWRRPVFESVVTDWKRRGLGDRGGREDLVAEVAGEHDLGPVAGRTVARHHVEADEVAFPLHGEGATLT